MDDKLPEKLRDPQEVLKNGERLLTLMEQPKLVLASKVVELEDQIEQMTAKVMEAMKLHFIGKS